MFLIALLQIQYNLTYIHNRTDIKHDSFCGNAKFLYKTTIVEYEYVLLLERTWQKDCNVKAPNEINI